MSQRPLTAREVQFLQESLRLDYESSGIRLREGEYQHALAKAIAAFQLEMCFPDVKDLVGKLHGEEEKDDVRLVRKIQTILKKMEKSNVVKILSKKQPWELQRYVLSSFKFQDVERNIVVFATDEQIERMQNQLHSKLKEQVKATAKPDNLKSKIWVLGFMILASYTAVLWDLMQPMINLVIFVPAFSIAVACSLILGKLLSKK